MDRDKSKMLLCVSMITLIIAMVVMAVFFMVNLAMHDTVLWQKVAYFIVVGLLVLATLFNVYAVLSDTFMFEVGMALYIVTLANVVINAIVYLTNSTLGLVPIEVLSSVMYLMFFSSTINVLAILIYKVSVIILGKR